tara:strand:- start:8698 stop:8892 length:195 start_codon:yes stop_codon:yes gene_type:complete
MGYEIPKPWKWEMCLHSETGLRLSAHGFFEGLEAVIIIRRLIGRKQVNRPYGSIAFPLDQLFFA